jgi:PAS domain S-box-containing protein
MEEQADSTDPVSSRPCNRNPGDWIFRPYSIALIGLALFILISGIAVFLGYQQFNTTRRNALNADRATANLLADVLREHNRATIGILQSYAYRPLFVAAVKRRSPAGVYRHLSGLKKNSEIDLTFITDKRGTLWANFPVFSEAIGENLSNRDWYKGVSSHWKPYISNVYKLISGEKSLAVAISVPVFDEKGRPIGILGCSQRLGFIDDAIERVPFSPYSIVNVIDRVGKILYSNRIPHKEMIADHWFFPIIESALKEKKQQIEVNDPQNDREKRYLTVVPVGNIGWTIVIGRPLRDIYGSERRRFVEIGVVSFLLFLLIMLFLVYLRKVSLFRITDELLQAETKLRQEHEKLRALSLRYEAILAAVPAIIMEVDKNKTYTWANSVGIEFFGEDVVGKEAAFYFEGEQDTYDTVKPLFNGDGDNIYVESWQRRRDGQKRLLAWWCRVLKDRDGNVAGALSAAYDITASKKAEEEKQALLTEVQQEKTKLSSLINSMADEVWFADTQKRFTIANPAAIKQFCLDDDQIVEVEKLVKSLTVLRPDGSIRPVEEAPPLRALLGEVVINQEELVQVPVSGELRYRQVNASPVRDSAGNIIGAVSVVRDITDRKQAEDRINRLNIELEQRVIERTAQLEASNKELESFSYTVSHDLRAPLRSIDGFSHALLEEYQEKLDDTGMDYLERVRRATQKMGYLIDDLLKLAGVARAEFNRGRFDLSKMIREMVEEHGKDCPDCDMDVAIQEGITVQGDRYLLKIAMQNLLDNAWKFTGRTEHPRIEFGETVRDGKPVCFIRDNGAGFDMKYADKLFGAFQRLHTLHEFPGTGIGLATVKRIISRHGGEVWAEGEIGKGATFYFALPMGK